MSWPIPPKPKGMRWATYDRLRHEVIQAEMVADAMLESQFERLCGRLGIVGRDNGFWR
jgi:hypothetical protein